MTLESPYGPLVIGEEAARRSEVARKKAANIYGPLVTGHESEPEPDADNPFILKVDGTAIELVSVKEMEKRLEAEPQLLPLAEKAEYHDGSPRRTAVALFARIRAKLEMGTAAPPKPTGSTIEETIPPAAGMGTDDVLAALDANPAAVLDLLAVEIGRADGPRQVVLLKMREAEGGRPAEVGGPRDAVLKQIDDALAALAPAE